MPTDPATAKVLHLRDGRALGYAEYGDPKGKPVLIFHGWPSSRLDAMWYCRAGKALGACVIGIDRPGIGLSTWKKGYRLLDWPIDVAEFADTSEFERFAVAGVSSGGPHALACARLIPERLTGCAVVAGVAPLDVPHPELFIVKTELQIVRLANRLPFVARLAFRYFAWQYQRNPGKTIEAYLKSMPDSDKEVLSRPEAKEHRREGFQEVIRQGARGPIDSIAIEGRPWGFVLEDVAMKVHLYQGEADTAALPAGARYMAEGLPDCEVRWYAGQGHLGAIVNGAKDVIRVLAADERAVSA